MSEELTPMQRQYRAIKRELPPGSILMFRLGDFYEMFGEDAVIASPILGATLTQRAGAPLCGIPYHALDAYLAKLIRAGKTAAICDQMEDPRLVKKGQVVRREVTRIVTPGTVTEDGLLDAGTNTYIAAVSGLGLALLDLSTGEFAVTFPPASSPSSRSRRATASTTRSRACVPPKSCCRVPRTTCRRPPASPTRTPGPSRSTPRRRNCCATST